MATVRLANGKHFEAASGVSILDAARAAGIVLEHSCRTGRCGTCKARVLEGCSRSIGDDSGLHPKERAAGWVLTCTSTAEGELLRLDLEDVGELADYPVRLLPCRVETIQPLAGNVMRVRLRFPPRSEFRYLPGQYVDVIGKGGVRRSYSIANVSRLDQSLELHVRQVEQGVLSDYWFGACKANDLLRLEGPKGTFFLRDVAGRDLVFLATGTGIAPFRALMGQLATREKEQHPRSTALYWGGRQSTDLYWEPDLAGVDLEFVPVLSRPDLGWGGECGHVQDALLRRGRELENTLVYACGSPAMIEGAQSKLAAAGLPPGRFYSDAFVSSSR